VKMRYDLHDALGSVIANVSLDEEEPQITWAAQYNAIGETLTQTSDTASPYRWNGGSGYYWDSDVEMHLMGLRWYDKGFFTRDPIGLAGGKNLYGYVGNNPLDRSDSLGLTDYKPIDWARFFKGWWDNLDLFGQWVFEKERDYHTYVARDPQTQDMMRSDAADQIRDEILSSNKLEGMGDWKTGQAGLGVIAGDPFKNPTAFQVGGFMYWWRKNADGTATIKIYNQLNIHSFFYHGLGLVKLPRKPRGQWPHIMGNVDQFFEWTEPIVPHQYNRTILLDPSMLQLPPDFRIYYGR